MTYLCMLTTLKQSKVIERLRAHAYKLFDRLSCNCTKPNARSLVVSDLRSETKGSQFESSCLLRAEVNSLQ